MSIDTHPSKPSTSLWNQMNWQPSARQLQQFIKLQSLLCYWNKQVNLTRLINGNDYWIAQIYDSLWPLKKELKTPGKSLNCIDIGSGCGFPGLAVAIALPKCKVTLVDSLSRKTKILQKISKSLGLCSQIKVCTNRAEVLGQKSNYRGQFDLAMARAVANASVVSEYLVPLLKSNGEAFIYKGKVDEKEQKALEAALEALNSKIKSIETTKLPENKGERLLLKVIQNGKCPDKYPRSIGIPTKRPLGS